jgi:hypothetical protein
MANQMRGFVVSTTPLLNEQAPLFSRPRCPRYQACHRCGAWKDGLSTLLINERSFVNTIDAIIEDATEASGSTLFMGYLLFTSSLSFHQVLSLVRL